MQAVDPSARSVTAAAESVARLIETQALEPHFQPIVQLRDGLIYGHEALIRTPPGCPWTTPDALFAAARAEGLTIELEIECVRLSLRAWAHSGAAGELFLNLSAAALVTAMAQRNIDSIIALSRSTSAARGGLVVELTEHEHVRDFDALALAVGRLRRHKVAVALDDFGDGRSSLRLWSQLKPEVVKIDKYFTQELSQHAEKLQTLRALLQISQTMGSVLVAEGIETAADLHLVRDLGITLGQGWVFGRPAARPLAEIRDEALEVIRSKDVAVFPERRRVSQQRASARTLMREVEPVSPLATNQELFDRFSQNEKMSAVAIVDAGAVVGLVSRHHFVNRYARPYSRELYGRKPCTMFANLTPRLVDLHADIDDLTAVLTSEDQRYLAEGVVITEAGQYRGLANGEDLVRTVTESRIEAARHANPLTLLPGNIPLTQHIQRLQSAEREFVACYADLNQFKPFNDQYGYWCGDEMILLAARCIAEQADPRRDFVGHVGGDDFVVLFQSDDWERRSHAIVETFNRAAVDLYDEQARSAGGLMAEDRHGDMRFHPLTTLCIGAVPVGSGLRMRRPEDVANAAALAKRRAKHGGVPVYVLAASDVLEAG
jgi:EAL domain-containing protein (putative c-di-GMP-specific phosphodiesterase class I)/GGDEF domain-containing protein